MCLCLFQSQESSDQAEKSLDESNSDLTELIKRRLESVASTGSSASSGFIEDKSYSDSEDDEEGKKKKTTSSQIFYWKVFCHVPGASHILLQALTWLGLFLESQIPPLAWSPLQFSHKKGEFCIMCKSCSCGVRGEMRMFHQICEVTLSLGFSL